MRKAEVITKIWHSYKISVLHILPSKKESLLSIIRYSMAIIMNCLWDNHSQNIRWDWEQWNFRIMPFWIETSEVVFFSFLRVILKLPLRFTNHLFIALSVSHLLNVYVFYVFLFPFGGVRDGMLIYHDIVWEDKCLGSFSRWWHELLSIHNPCPTRTPSHTLHIAHLWRP